MNGLSNSIRMAGGNGKQSRLESSRLAQGAAIGCGLSGDFAGTQGLHDWPGKTYGIRRPESCETPLSDSEVNLFLHAGAYL